MRIFTNLNLNDFYQLVNKCLEYDLVFFPPRDVRSIFTVLLFNKQVLECTKGSTNVL